MQVIKIEKKGSVLIKDGDIEAWVDVWVRDDGDDVCCGWNQYIFCANDRDLQMWQDVPGNFDMATSLAIEALEKAGHIHQDKNGKWYTNN